MPKIATIHINTSVAGEASVTKIGATGPTGPAGPAGADGVNPDGAVLFDEEQSLTEAQATQARANVGSVKPVTLTEAEYELLTPEEQADETILYLITD